MRPRRQIAYNGLQFAEGGALEAQTQATTNVY